MILGLVVPVAIFVAGGAIAISWRLGAMYQRLNDICRETDEIRDEIRDMRGDMHMTPHQNQMQQSERLGELGPQ